MPFTIPITPYEVPLSPPVLLREAEPDDARACEQTWRSLLDSLGADDAAWNWSAQIARARSEPGRACIAAWATGQAAVRLSIELGHEGRIGLHSKPVSESFYREKLGLLDLGLDVVEDGEWVYFEATPMVARGLL